MSQFTNDIFNVSMVWFFSKITNAKISDWFDVKFIHLQKFFLGLLESCE